jgi:transposase
MPALVTDELWGAIAPYLPPRPPSPKGGRPPVEDRKALAGILFVLREGLRWQSLPTEMGCGSGSTCWRRFAAWTAAGVWDKAHTHLLAALGERGLVNLERAVIDSASTRAVKGGRTLAPTRPTGPSGGSSGTC